MIVRQCGSRHTKSGEPCTQLVDEGTPACAAGHLNACHLVRPVVQRPVSVSSASPVAAVDELVAGTPRAPAIEPTNQGKAGEKPSSEATCYETIGYLRRNPLYELTHNEAVDLADLVSARDVEIAELKAQVATLAASTAPKRSAAVG